MAYRLTRAAEEQIDALLLDSALIWGRETAGRYGQLILVAVAALGNEPDMPGSVEVSQLPGIRAYPARLSRLRV